jgi:D-arabinose 1-dehydrogenase
MIGLPVRLLVELSELVKKELGQPLDIVLSYSNMTLQNSTLESASSKFYQAGVQRVVTASPLSMGLLRSEGPHPWHPATKEQKEAVIKAGRYIEEQGHNMADTSMRFVFARWNGTVIGGWSSIKELEDAVKMWHKVKSGEERQKDEILWNKAREIMGNQVDTMWSSPEKGWEFHDGSKFE